MDISGMSLTLTEYPDRMSAYPVYVTFIYLTYIWRTRSEVVFVRELIQLPITKWIQFLRFQCPIEMSLSVISQYIRKDEAWTCYIRYWSFPSLPKHKPDTDICMNKRLVVHKKTAIFKRLANICYHSSGNYLITATETVLIAYINCLNKLLH